MLYEKINVSNIKKDKWGITIEIFVKNTFFFTKHPLFPPCLVTPVGKKSVYSPPTGNIFNIQYLQKNINANYYKIWEILHVLVKWKSSFARILCNVLVC